MKKYKVNFHGDFHVNPKIEVVEVERETDSSIWVNGNRFSKRGAWKSYFNTFEEAKAALIEKQKEKNKRLERSLKRGTAVLNEVEALSEPQNNP